MNSVTASFAERYPHAAAARTMRGNFLDHFVRRGLSNATSLFELARQAADYQAAR